ncbi:rano class II histocompatibility antigen, A beta chain-like [Epinephelus fuscoguttatus]|uniref:rano class II histocompatibility antigen, A beta chain-like n=1 Tax=Epinephelus fuscoguttatus TaxID=293821 RepID=UPI0020D04744|nr:rano class II histocompatibility antigen, A beta chain-like [Epinephelus fuscoguttatus]
MHIHNFLFCVILCLFSPVFSDEDFIQLKACCTFNGPGLKDIEYIIVNRFNKKVIMQYNSTRGNWKGFTPFAIEKASNWSRDPYDAQLRAFEIKIFCEDNIDPVQQLANLTSAPTIKINLVKRPSMLVCSAYNFYPKQIRMTWLRNGEEVTSAVSFSKVMSVGDWYYQIHSYLVHTPTREERMTCMVEHLTLSEPVLQVWDPSLPVTEWIKIGVGVFALMLGFVILISGFIYYKKKSAAHFTFCQGRVSIPVEDLPAAEAT